MKFTELNLHPTVLAGVEAQNFIECTPIQTASIPLILEGKDVAGLAQTGTGKTAAYLLPLMDRIMRAKEAPVEVPEGGEKIKNRPFENWKDSNFILILVPTRELAEQVHENAVKLGEVCKMTSVPVYGGMSYQPQKNAINRGVQFLVATPGRLIDLFKEHIVDLNQVRAVVFDEADRMFDMGFKDDMKYLLKRIPSDRQFLVYSATLNFDVLNVAYEFGSDPVEINVSRDQAQAENVKDELFHVGDKDKPAQLLSLFKKHKPRQAIIFSNFKSQVEKIATFLSENGIPAMGISSLLTQAQRNRVMEQFKQEGNNQNVLVATDVAARGLDIKGVDIVVNYELPDDPENYVHRIGRTGRAGETGLAFSLASDRDVDALSRIENYVNHKIELGWLDDEDLVKEHKPFPREERFRGGGSYSNKKSSRPRKPSGRPGSPRRRDDSRGDKKYKGPREGSRDTRPKDGEPETRSQDSPRESRRPDRQRPPRRHENDKSQRRPDRNTESSGNGQQRHRDKVLGRHKDLDAKDTTGQASESRHQNRNGGSSGAQSKSKGQQRRKVYKHKPKSERFDPTHRPYKKKDGESSKDVGVGNKVAKFFKKLFS